MSEYRLTPSVKFTRPIVKVAIRSIFRILSPIKIEGKENIPFGKPYILAMNHVSIFDPPFIATFWPEMLEIIAAQTAFERRGQKEILEWYGVIPVHRDEYDRALLDTIFSAIHSGHPLLIAPEGSRSGEVAMQRAKPGVAYIFEKAQVPIVPAGIIGTTSDYWDRAKRGKRPPLTLRIGPEINLPPIVSKGKERRKSRQANADLVMSHIAGLLPDEYHGVYAESVIKLT
ncbi:MAG: 1-acyl-sn-glycerol-3-phosphate acyltransferase [Anaerolineae bacterium]|jgi:1-acyl-sn-glycerol-3-phosphate acyltransferase|nr:1-acyl-sn-glycerol-3-phosphate acyltransferase [Anaerolineae bacterium]MBT7189990.1 1-acyl-sn-glycerol-3-phosphate acyltransferase [Anaerolineae bacterium]MBT7991076.1 1-acyl-sn-glycerol-3-phosphate acyltransferase [Anaerolineae bacterium]